MSSRPSGLTRRRFLVASGVTGGAALAAGGATLTLGQRDRLLGAAATRRPLAPGSGVLVLLTLYGGNDGLSMVAPAGDPAYQAARTGLALAEHEVLGIGAGLGLHPALVQLKKRWDAGQLAVVRGVGYPAPDHSHFRSMAIWQTASPDTSVSTGWLGRWLDATGTDPLRALAVGPTPPPLLVGGTSTGACVPTGPFRLPDGPLAAPFRALESASQAGEPALLQAVARSGADLLAVAGRLTPALGSAAPAAPSAPTPSAPAPSAPTPSRRPSHPLGGELADQLDVVARCILAGVPTRVYAVSLNGFDTHADEKADQATLLAELDGAVGAFLARVSGSQHGAGVVLAAYSEFGRRVAANASGGTDHGTAAPVLVVGPGVRGGLYGEQPSLTDLVDGDLKVTTDFRDVYATLLERVLGADPGAVFPGQRRTALGFV